MENNLSIQKIKAVFISHEHTDHIRGLYSFLKKYSVPVYITTATLQFSRLYFERVAVKNFKPHETVAVGDLRITAFPKLHDASDPYSFTVSCSNIKVGIFTDIGLPCQNVINHFKQCHAAFLEANYDDEMLNNGNYPYHLKKRILGEKGHEILKLGPVDHSGTFSQHLVKADTIFGSAVDEPDSYALVSCVVAPGFDFSDFELFKTDDLLPLFPESEEIIRKLT